MSAEPTLGRLCPSEAEDDGESRREPALRPAPSPGSGRRAVLRAAPDQDLDPAAPEDRDDQSESKGKRASRFGRGRKSGQETGEREGRGARRRLLRHRGLRSPLMRRILVLNLLVIVVPVFGLLHLSQYRESLISTELEAMQIQARAFAWSLGNTASVSGLDGGERLFPDLTRSLMRVLLRDTGLRARVFDPDGALIVDSFTLTGPGGPVQVVELPPPDDGSFIGELGRTYDQIIDWLPGMAALPLYREAALQKAADYQEAALALTGESGGMARIDSNDRLRLTMAVPVQRYRQVLGALMISKDGDKISEGVRDRRRDVLIVFGVALFVSVLLSVYLAGTIARPIRRLALAAGSVRYGKGRQFEIPDFSRRRDEIGDLSEALREMTENLWTRLDAIEHFAADVAHEIKNPLTSLRSAVETVARVEEPEQQRKLMTIILDDVQRLDRLISDISDASRLDAELSRAESETVDVGRLLDALVEVHKATLGAAAEEGDGRPAPQFALSLPRGKPLLVQGLEGRLGQVFRNLIANAISFSPPDGAIRLSARREDGWAVIVVEDEGPGIPDGKLESVFDRFYSERPQGEKFGTHSGLGLSISRQIIEAHHGSIEAQNLADDLADDLPHGSGSGRAGQARTGARFIVRLPMESAAG